MEPQRLRITVRVLVVTAVHRIPALEGTRQSTSEITSRLVAVVVLALIVLVSFVASNFLNVPIQVQVQRPPPFYTAPRDRSSISTDIAATGVFF